jgi:hypothetical protein
MQTNDKVYLTPKQQNLLFGLAEGLSHKEAAQRADLHPSSASVILRRPGFREELNRLRAEAVARMAARLPTLVETALDVLEHELNFPSERRLRSVKLTLDLAAKLCGDSATTLTSAHGHPETTEVIEIHGG